MADREETGGTAERPPVRMKVDAPVFFGSTAVILLLVAFAVVVPDAAASVFADVQSWIIETFGWFYILTVAGFLVFVVSLALSSYGRVKLGPDDSEPEFRWSSWIAMLFSAGMGIGLMFFGVAEPVMHYSAPPVGEGGTVDAAREAMKISFFHWGIHAWAIYAVIGLSLAYFAFRHGLPLTIRSALYPLLGERIYGPIGQAVDIFAVLGTMFGIATSLGFGVLQINAGLAYLLGIEETVWVQLVLIGIITLIATGSVVAGLDAGIRRISELNLLMALFLVLFVLLTGPTLFLFEATVQNTGAYLSDIVAKTFTLYAYEPTDWIGGWTLFYWAWWIAWSPFVGMFIARVSRGRTIRQFVVGVLFVPVGFTFVWMTVFGNTAIALDMGVAGGALSAAVADNVPQALFQFLEYLPLSAIVSTVATVLVVTFFVTSSDSGSLVIDTITTGGAEDGPTWQRVFWAVKEGVVAGVLLLAGGLSALQTASIAGALPFAAVMVLVCWGLHRALRAEAAREASRGLPVLSGGGAAGIPWQRRLAMIVSHPRQEQVASFLTGTVEPALKAVAEEIRKRGLEVDVTSGDGEAMMTVRHGEEREFVYAVRMKGYIAPSFAFPEPPPRAGDAHRYWRAEAHLLEGGQDYDVMGYTRDQVIADVLAQYERHMHFLHLMR